LVAAVITLVATKPTTENAADPSENQQTADSLLKNAQELLKRIDARYAEWSNKQSLAGWNYASNLTDENLAEKLNVSAESARVSKQIAQEVNAFPWGDLEDESIKRQFKKLGVLGPAALPEDVRIYEEIYINHTERNNCGNIFLKTLKFKYLQLVLQSFNKNKNSTEYYKNIITTATNNY